MGSFHYVIVVQLTVLPAWLALSRARRHEVVREQIDPVFAAHPACSMRWIDAEAMTARCSDVMLVETDDLREWNYLWEQIRDSDLFAVPYAQLVDITVGIEDGYLGYEASGEVGVVGGEQHRAGA